MFLFYMMLLQIASQPPRFALEAGSELPLRTLEDARDAEPHAVAHVWTEAEAEFAYRLRPVRIRERCRRKGLGVPGRADALPAEMVPWSKANREAGLASGHRSTNAQTAGVAQ